jgi:hypothetical protein
LTTNCTHFNLWDPWRRERERCYPVETLHARPLRHGPSASSLLRWEHFSVETFDVRGAGLSSRPPCVIAHKVAIWGVLQRCSQTFRSASSSASR